jgi:hypothetical protein
MAAACHTRNAKRAASLGRTPPAQSHRNFRFLPFHLIALLAPTRAGDFPAGYSSISMLTQRLPATGAQKIHHQTQK